MKRKCVVYDVTIYLLEGKFILWNKLALLLTLIISCRGPPCFQNVKFENLGGFIICLNMN